MEVEVETPSNRKTRMHLVTLLLCALPATLAAPYDPVFNKHTDTLTLYTFLRPSGPASQQFRGGEWSPLRFKALQGLYDEWSPVRGGVQFRKSAAPSNSVQCNARQAEGVKTADGEAIEYKFDCASSTHGHHRFRTGGGGAWDNNWSTYPTYWNSAGAVHGSMTYPYHGEALI